VVLVGVGNLPAVKGSHPADAPAGGITEEPPDCITVPEEGVGRRIEHGLHILEERLNPVFVALIDISWEIMKFPYVLFAFYLRKMKITGHYPQNIQIWLKFSQSFRKSNGSVRRRARSGE
jgi:hypothetical protein